MSQNNMPIRSAEFKTVEYAGNITKKKIDPAALRRQLEKKRERDSQEVVVRFINMESKGGWLKFGLKLYPGEKFRFYCLFDGEIYRLPRGVVNHLNNECYSIEYQSIKGEFLNGVPVQAAYNTGYFDHQMQARRKVHRFRCEVMEMDNDDFDMRQSNVVEVEKRIPTSTEIQDSKA